MSSTREERLQMRQRGAGTRKIQQVDFGFSFGGAEAGPSDPTPPLFPEPAKPPQTQTISTATPLPPKTSQPESQTRSQSDNTPGSARNNVAQRASTYDIPLDDRPEEPRSHKRRKMNPSDENSETPSRQAPRTSEGDSSNTTQNGASVPEEASATQDADISLNVNNGNKSPDTGVRTDAIEQQLPTETQTPRADSSLQTNTEAPRKSRSPQAPIPEKQAMVESIKSASTKKHQQKSLSPPRSTRSSPQQTKEKKSKEQIQHTNRVSKGGRVPKARVSQSRPTSSGTSASDPDPETSGASEDNQRGTEPEPDTRNVAETKASSQKPPKATKKTRGRNGRSPNSDAAASEATKETIPVVEAEPKATNVQSKKSRGKRPANEQSIPGKATNGKAKGGSAPAPEPEPETRDPEPEAGPSNSRRGKVGKKGKKAAEPKSPVRKEQPEAEADPEPETAPEASKPRRGKANKKAKRATEPGSPATNTEEPSNPEEAPQSEPQQPQEAETQAEPSPSKARAGRRGKKSKKSTEAESATVEEQPETETAQEGRRKTREPRGETVPVTVHRLVNPSALGAIHASVDSGDEDEESTAQNSTQDMEKLPNRGGVNPADVLGQICRETLEKTLTALQNGIANETNTQRRAEWTRKRKAVEAFGSELDSRLLDLSEMLDSNFVLGVQLKKSKREMMDLRGRLYKVRQERESLTLQMDAVRGKHMEEEAAKISRTTINNSLHSLDLALDRSQNRASPTTEPSSADLEFMLRTVADDVSCRAPGAQGGLLNQIRAFNAQLETTARRMER
ncbi:hypothetical protein N7456_010103 [Penicillium angulare]|uniref:Inner kinetochore subunit AME1 domain-containing protein n=1 Tax=Penicillium angulare TaxID=116970 RepID=A0A9W9F632_9EURO|nr:hypothetical protein N7456_010103 [Penicillium angulare]